VREIRIPGIRRLLRVSWSDDAVRREVDDEIRFHIDARVEEMLRLGASEKEARERAESEFGDVRRSKRELVDVDRRRMGHEKRGELLMSFIEDVRYAARGLMRRPALLIVTTLALSIGIAANAIMFGVVDQLLLRPPAHVAAPEALRRVYFLYSKWGTQVQATTTYPVVAALQRNLRIADVVGLDHSAKYSLGSGADARQVDVQMVSGNFFSVLGTQPAMGRGFALDEDRIPQGAPVVVVSDGFWRRELGEASDAVGRVLHLNGKPFTIVGVAPKGFSGIDREYVDAWVPISAMAPYVMNPDWHNKPNSWWVEAIVRLRPDVTPEVTATQATAAYRAEMKSWGEDQAQDSISSVVLGSIIGTRTPQGLSRESKISLWLMGVSAIVLLIACANVANLLIARNFQRRREIAVRLALGVSRGRLLRMLLTESGLLAAISATMALAIAFIASRLVQRVLLPGIVWDDSVLDARVLAFTLLVTVACIVLSGIAPALQGIGTKVSDALKASSSQIAGSRSRLRYSLLVAQAALSFVLLIGAGLFVRSLRNVIGRDVGIDLDRVVLVSMDLDRLGFSKAQIEDVFRRGQERLSSIPGLASSAIVRQSVPSQSGNAMGFTVPGVERPEIPGGGPYYSVVGGSFFSTMGTSVLRGRNFTESEERTPSRVMMINKIVADAYWPGKDPLGQCVKLEDDATCTTVVGVVENVMLFALVKDDRAMLYLPPAHVSFGDRPPAAFVARSNGDPKPMLALIRKEIQALEPNMPFVQVEPYIDRVAWQLRPWRLGATMFTLFGVVALIIAAVGLYSVMAYWVSQRTHEIGVRMALGAQRADVVRLVAWQSSRAVITGLLLGALAAALASRWVVDMLYETSPRDPIVYGGAALVLVAAALVASVVPARRSAAVDPALAIRTE